MTMATTSANAEFAEPGEQQVVTPGELWAQVRGDWSGKEVQNGYTLTYVWMANQLGHFALGLGINSLLTWGLSAIAAGLGIDLMLAFSARWRELGWWALVHAIPVVQLAGWSAKEYWDYRVARRQAQGNIFDFNGWDVMLDAATAVGFIAAGIAVSYVAFWSHGAAVLVFAVALVLTVFVGWYWLKRKYCFQRALIPYLYRLADVGSEFTVGPEEVRRVVDGFLAGSGHRHLLVFGSPGTGRTGLSVALLTEHCFGVHKARYMSWSRLIERARMGDDRPEHDGRAAWPRGDSDIVAIDDVVKASEAEGAVLLQQFQQDLDLLPAAEAAMLARRRTVWVLGQPGPDAQQPYTAWVRAVARSLGVVESSVGVLHIRSLSPTARARTRTRRLSSFLGH